MPTRQKILALLITLLGCVALTASAYLTWVTLQSDTVAGCTAESAFDCNNVLASRWSKWLSLPVSLLGALTYVAILASCWPAALRPGGKAMTLLFALAVTVAGSAVWFIGLQALQIQSFCLHCMTVHSCGLLIAILTLMMLSASNSATDYNQMRSLLGVAADDPPHSATVQSLTPARLFTALGIAAISLSALMGGQLLFGEDPQTMEEIQFPLTSAEADPEQSTTTQPNSENTASQTNLANSQSSTSESSTSEISTSELPANNSEPPANAPADSPEDQQIAQDPSPDDSQEPSQDINQESEEFEEMLDLPSLAADAINTSPTQSDQTSPDSSATRPRRMAFAGLQQEIDTQSMPLIGNPSAKHVIVEIMDYTCGHCRELHPHIINSVERYGDQLAVLIHHVPLSSKCNPYGIRGNPLKVNACDYAKLSIGVWKLNPQKFAEYHNWLLKPEKPPSVYEARTKAISLVGSEILLDKSLKADVNQRIAGQNEAFAKLKVGLPVILLTNGALRGVPSNDEQLFQFFENKLGVQPLK